MGNKSNLFYFFGRFREALLDFHLLSQSLFIKLQDDVPLFDGEPLQKGCSALYELFFVKRFFELLNLQKEWLHNEDNFDGDIFERYVVCSDSAFIQMVQ